MKIAVEHSCDNFESYRAERVKSLFNAESGHVWKKEVELPIEDGAWQIGLVVGASGSGKTSIGQRIFPENGLVDLFADWPADRPIIDCIAPDGDFNTVTSALSAVGLGDVPAWLRPFRVLSNGEQFRAGLARLICDGPEVAVVDEFTSVVDRQIAKVGAMAFVKSWRKLGSKKIVLLSCHYDIAEWLQPDWVYDTVNARFSRERLRRPPIELEIVKTNGTYWKYFKSHHYLDLPHPIAAEYFMGVINGEAVAHLSASPAFHVGGYRAARLVVMPEWQGVGIGTKFLEAVCQYHLEGNGRQNKKLPTYFSTSHPRLCSYLRSSSKWIQVSAALYGDNKQRNIESLARTAKSDILNNRGNAGFGGHFRAVQGFKYIGNSADSF